MGGWPILLLGTRPTGENAAIPQPRTSLPSGERQRYPRLIQKILPRSCVAGPRPRPALLDGPRIAGGMGRMSIQIV
jgi:hypothetical protein